MNASSSTVEAGEQPTVSPRSCVLARTRFSIFEECPHCGGDMAPEHAHYRCTSCGWRDSCCD